MSDAESIQNLDGKHTPGSYHVEAGSVWAEAADGSNLKLATVHAVLYHVSVAERNANAQLFAAAPDLLAACKALVRYVETCGEYKHGVPMDLARAAIAKADLRG